MDGYKELRDAIVSQAVADYCNAVTEIMNLYDKEKAIEKIKKTVKKTRCKDISRKEAEIRWRMKISIQEDRMHEVVRFIRSDWYKELTWIDSEKMIKMMKEKAIDRKVDYAIRLLQEVNEDNLQSKRSKRALEYFEIFKKFLYSDTLIKITQKPARYYIQKIKRESKCDFL